jgi:hypothetical protein
MDGEERVGGVMFFGSREDAKTRRRAYMLVDHLDFWGLSRACPFLLRAFAPSREPNIKSSNVHLIFSEQGGF